MSYLQKFQALAEQLRAHPDIELTVANIPPPASEEQLAAARAYAPVPPALESLYREMNGCRIEWRYTGARTWHTPFGAYGDPYEVHAAGRIQIPELRHVFCSHEGSLWGDGWGEAFKGLHPIDHFTDEAMVALDFQADGSAPRVVYHYSGEDVSPLGMSIEQYLESLFWSRGFPYAARILSEDNGSSGLHSEASFALCMPEIFDDFELDRYTRGSGEPICPRLRVGGKPPPRSATPGLPPGANPNLPSVTFTVGGTPKKKKLVALALALFFGFVGAHRFYLGYRGPAVIQLATCGGCGLWCWLDVVLIALNKLPDGYGRALETSNA
ncbi:MAG: TM2 domain-containing protein [Sandaracinaceae bacterium]